MANHLNAFKRCASKCKGCGATSVERMAGNLIGRDDGVQFGDEPGMGWDVASFIKP